MIQPWFNDAKLGIFIHWGIYAVKGIPESWSFFNGQISYDDYMAQLKGFTAAKYDPQAWARLFKDAGARYAVLTTKHHDGVALWPTRESDLNVVSRTPAGRDLVGPYCQALRQAGLKVGLYFSHLDWSHPDYASVFHPDRSKEEMWNHDKYHFSHPRPGVTPRPEGWDNFIRFHRAQLGELCRQYKPDLLWFDGDWDRTHEQWKMKELDAFLRGLRPKVILNDRMGGYGDYKTPEQGIPIAQPTGPWEFCMTINDSWGYQGKDKNWKTPRMLVRMFGEVLGMGGNLLLDIGPRPDGSIPREATERLQALGDWIRTHEEAVYGSRAGLPHGHFLGSSTLNKKGDTLYLIVYDMPQDAIAVKGIQNEIRRVSVLGKGTVLKHRKVGGAPWMRVPGVLWVDVPRKACHPLATVIKVELKGKLELYTGAGKAITAN